MNKDSILRETGAFILVNDYNPLDVIVTHGGALVLSGRRDTTRDIDLWVSRDIWVNEIKKGGKPKCLGNGIWMISVSKFMDIHIGWSLPENGIRKTWNGCLFLSERALLTEYKKLNRRKDKSTIAMLELVVTIRNKCNLN